MMKRDVRTEELIGLKEIDILPDVHIFLTVFCSVEFSKVLSYVLIRRKKANAAVGEDRYILNAEGPRTFEMK
jgi:hypothetical protein